MSGYGKGWHKIKNWNFKTIILGLALRRMSVSQIMGKYFRIFIGLEFRNDLKFQKNAGIFHKDKQVR